MTKDSELYMKYFNIKLSEEIDVLQLLDKLEDLAKDKVLNERMKMTGLDLAEMVVDSVIESPLKCPECGHPMDMHVAEPTYIFMDDSMSDESKKHTNMIVCQVPDCHKTKGMQGCCFSSIPDELLGEPNGKLSRKRRFNNMIISLMVKLHLVRRK